MDHRFLNYLYPKQATKWIWLFGIASVVFILSIQYYELPIISGISFLLSGAKSSFLQESYVSNGDNKSLKSYDLQDSYPRVNGSIIPSVPPPQDVKTNNASSLSMSRMNEMLQKSRLSPHSVVCI